MLTIFTTAKPFLGPAAELQRNAMLSWTLLRPRPEIIVFADGEEGVKEICSELGLRCVSGVKRSKFGTPIMSDLFSKARRSASHEFLSYINADIIVTQGLIQALDIARQRWSQFALICTPWHLSSDKAIDCSLHRGEGQLQDVIQKTGCAPIPMGGADIFIFTRDVYDNIPPFSMGRLCLDNWLIYEARRKRIPLIEASKFVVSAHIDHANSTHCGIFIKNEETVSNYSLCGFWARSFIAYDATYLLENDGKIRKKGFFELLEPRISSIKMFIVSKKFMRRMFYWKNKILHRDVP